MPPAFPVFCAKLPHRDSYVSPLFHGLFSRVLPAFRLFLRARLLTCRHASEVTRWAPSFRRCCATSMASAATASTAATTTTPRQGYKPKLRKSTCYCAVCATKLWPSLQPRGGYTPRFCKYIYKTPRRGYAPRLRAVCAAKLRPSLQPRRGYTPMLCKYTCDATPKLHAETLFIYIRLRRLRRQATAKSLCIGIAFASE